MRQEDIPLNKLFVSDLNTRKDLQAGQEDSGITELAASICQNGLLSPPIVRPVSDERYEVIIGQRRLLACQQVGLDPVPCLVREGIDDIDAVALSLVENVHRADMHPLDKARALKALYDRYSSYGRVANETAWSASTVRKYIQLLSLPEELQERIKGGREIMSAVVLPNYSENRGVAEIGDVVLKNKSGGWGPEKFLVTKTKRNNSFVDISIIGNGKLLGYQENVPASELCPIGEAEIKVVNKR